MLCLTGTTILLRSLPLGLLLRVSVAHGRFVEFSLSMDVVLIVSQVRAYSDRSLWSTLHVNQHVEAERLRFVLAKTQDAALRVRIAFMDVRVRPDQQGDLLPVHAILDRLLDILLPTAHRWTSFYFHTEHPGAFLHVRSRCAGVSVPLLRSLALSYSYMPGYSEFPESDNIYERPMESSDWFDGVYTRLRHLDLCSVYLPWHTNGVLDTVTCLDLSTFTDLSRHDVVLVFAAPNVQFLRIGSVSEWVTFPHTPLFSTTLIVLDLGIDGRRHMSDLLHDIRAPNLVDLTLRDIDSMLDGVLTSRVLLGQLTRFAIYGRVVASHPVSFMSVMSNLFNLLARMTVLDLHHARGDVFAAFCRWSYYSSVRGPTLTALYLSRVCLDELFQFLVYSGIHAGSDGGDLTLRSLAIRPLHPGTDRALLRWVRLHLRDFSFVKQAGRTLSTLRGPSYHSKCCFVP